jgi:hypothetical protein
MYHEEARRILPAARVSGDLTDRFWANPSHAKVARGILSELLPASGIRSARPRPPRAQHNQRLDEVPAAARSAKSVGASGATTGTVEGCIGGRAYALPPPDCYLLNEELAAVLASNGS